MNNQWNYTIRKILIAMLILTIAAIAYLLEATKPQPDAVYGVVNQNIEWAGAGYNGVWAGETVEDV